jgi:hypothetical protein
MNYSPQPQLNIIVICVSMHYLALTPNKKGLRLMCLPLYSILLALGNPTVHYFRQQRIHSLARKFKNLKVMANEKRGGMKVVAFDKSPFKLFTLRFSTKSVQASSCKRTKTTQRILFLSFEINNWFPIYHIFI